MNSKIFLQSLKHATDLSEKGLGHVSPNPCVGCVILDESFNSIAEGFHEKYGEAHAEANALKKIADTQVLTGAYVFVTLEPCAHEGKTPSCAKTLAQYPIKAVIALVKDPNPLVCGQGFKILQDKGIATYFAQDLLDGNYNKNQSDDKDVFAETFKEFADNRVQSKRLAKLIERSKNLNASFFFAIQNDRPYVTLKWAQSLNGVIGHDERRLLISGNKAMAFTHHLRATRDVTLVGYKTVLQDNPSLNIRMGSIQKKNRIAILDARLEILKPNLDLNIFKVHSPQNVFVITDEALRSDPRCESFSGNIIFVGQTDGKLDVESALKTLKSQHNIHSVLVEGGAMTIKDFYEKNLWNEICVYISFKIIKGNKIKISLVNILFSYFKKSKLQILGWDLKLLFKK